MPNIDKIKLLHRLIKPWSTISDDDTVIGDIRQIAIGRFDLCGCLLRAIQKRALYKGMTIGHPSSKRRTFKTMALALGIFELVAKL